MKCSEIQFELALHADDVEDSPRVALHLESCPVCRDGFAEILAIRNDLRTFGRPEIPVTTQDSLKRAIRANVSANRVRWSNFTPDLVEWIQMRVMPFGVGVFASAIIGFAFITMMFSGYLASQRPLGRVGNGTSGLLAVNTNPFHKLAPGEISADEYVRTRLNFASESPSVNPQGALIALTKSLVRGGMKDDEVVVVADVFGNGLAQIAEVIEPSRDRRAVLELRKALESDPAYAAFVPANLENRPDSVRVILKFQSVDVSTSRRTRR
ncbi:MAG: hypothetical protein WKF34_10840 [Pyrinomonadaceae bacterium]